MTREFDEILHKPEPVAESQREDNEGWGTKLLREAQVFGKAAVNSLDNGVKEAIDDPGGTALRAGSAFVLGFGLGGLARAGGAGSFLAKSVGVGFTVSLVADGLDKRRWDGVSKAWSDTWQSKENVERSQKLVEDSVGRFAVDLGAMTVLGGAGAYAGGKFFGTRALAADLKMHDSAKVLGARTFEASAEPVRAIGPAAKDGTIGIAHDGSRIIYKPDGHVITVGKDGTTTVRKPGGEMFTRLPNGTITSEVPGLNSAEVAKLGDRVPGAEPLNVYSRSQEQIGRLLSNFAHTPFELDGIRYGSVEAFYQSLKLPEAQRASVRDLWGYKAKEVGRGLHPTHTTYNGTEIELGSKAHHDLVKRAITAKIEQTPNLKEGLLATGERPIVHDTGGPESPTTRYPNRVFARTLEEIRSDLAAMKGRTLTGPKPIHEALSEVKDPVADRNHSVSAYAEALRGMDFKVDKYLGSGSDSMAFRLENGDVLKITGNRQLTPEMGNRSFDLPILEQGTKQVGDAQVTYFVQPHAEPANHADVMSFFGQLQGQGYAWRDPGAGQIGRWNGQIKLIDPFAVVKK